MLGLAAMSRPATENGDRRGNRVVRLWPGEGHARPANAGRWRRARGLGRRRVRSRRSTRRLRRHCVRKWRRRRRRSWRKQRYGRRCFLRWRHLRSTNQRGIWRHHRGDVVHAHHRQGRIGRASVPACPRAHCRAATQDPDGGQKHRLAVDHPASAQEPPGGTRFPGRLPMPHNATFAASPLRSPHFPDRPPVPRRGSATGC